MYFNILFIVCGFRVFLVPMEWCKVTIDALVEAYSKEECLCNNESPLYHNKQARRFGECVPSTEGYKGTNNSIWHTSYMLSQLCFAVGFLSWRELFHVIPSLEAPALYRSNLEDAANIVSGFLYMIQNNSSITSHCLQSFL